MHEEYHWNCFMIIFKQRNGKWHKIENKVYGFKYKYCHVKNLIHKTMQQQNNKTFNIIID